MKKYLIIGFGICLLVVIAWGVKTFYGLPKTAFVTTQEIFNEFALTIELERKLTQIENQQKNYLDSLKISINKRYKELQNTVDPDPNKIAIFEKAQEDYLVKEEYFVNQHNQLTQSYNGQIWKQLNQYIKEYGEKNDYQYIYGASGEGNLMYARSSEDITKEIIEYINNRYEGNL